MDIRFLIHPFNRSYQSAVETLVLAIQRDEFGLALSASNQPDLKDIAEYFGTPESAFWIAATNFGDIIGCVGLEDLGSGVAVMRKFMVHQAWRGAAKGVASALLKTFEDSAKSHRFALLILSTVETTRAAQRFYEKAGYTRVDRSAMPVRYKPGALDSVYFSKEIQA